MATTRPTGRGTTPSVPKIEFSGLVIAPALRTRVRQRVRQALAGVKTSPVRVHVSFADVNGPKGGKDVRCAIDVNIPRTAPLHVEELAETDALAFDMSAAVIARSIGERLERRRESGRRPKKYYAARRLL